MLCRCSTTTLRLFIRSVAQIDLPTSANSPRNYVLKSSTRAFIGSHQAQRRCISTHTSLGNVQPAGLTGRATEVHQSDQQDDKVNTKDFVDQGVEDIVDHAVVDFSLDAIDDIVAESKVSNSRVDQTITADDSPAGFVTETVEWQRERRERKWERTKDLLQETTTRRIRNLSERSPNGRTTESEDDNLGQHATFPRLPRISREPIPAPPLKSRIQDPLKIQRPSRAADIPRKEREHWQIDKEAIKAKYPSGYNPPKRLSPDAIAGIRALHAQMPDEYHTRKLAETFQVSPEAISRILRSKWRPDAEEEADRARRWLKRGESVWTRYAEMGVKPPKKWRDVGVGKDLPQEILTKRRERKPKSGSIPALVTLPKRQDGVFQVGGKRRKASSDEGASFI